ncbi:uncharacterized protein I206_102950 [Kwoniella pini CBS 10737]|uniref:RING-type E3 ubiquitin transferase n=1 Tax=Kwoniella pini CBS 10737 TaxID=1296096 RepID=A0A1B9I6S1_9TREE|nr:uncharacterized protein I206_03301 [Kwoniella pini CBS 10737]OCF51235.1 hypothetical protein I206_03301 [Kwoniella pini CBS 10737]
MPRKQAVDQAIYLDEAEGFILEHALFSPPRTWPPLPPEPQAIRLAAGQKKMNWEAEVLNHPDEPIDIPIRKHSNREEGDEDADADSERCVICLMNIRDRTIVGVCGHEFCFECIGVWANQSRRCPLCSADMAPFLLHDLDASTPTKFYLPPLPSRPILSSSLPGPSRNRLPEIVRRERAEQRVKEEPDELDLQVKRRREIYRYELYVKHIGSNPHTKFRPNPTPRQICADQSLIQRATAFLRRELRVWSLVDVEFMTTYIISLLKTIDIRSEPAIRLLADYLDLNEEYPNSAEHFSHELYSFLRSPFKELRKWDEVIQYDSIPSHSRSPSPESSKRSRSPSRSPPPRPQSRSLSPSRSIKSGRGRQWSKRDVFVPSVSPDSKRWNENDSWLDPEYAAWLEEEKRREEERRERKRSRRTSQHDREHKGHEEYEQKPMRTWGEEKKKVELLPESGGPPLRMNELPEPSKEINLHDEDEKKPDLENRNGGLSIRGAAKSTTPPIPTQPKARRNLLERLAKEKAASANVAVSPPSAPLNGVTTKKLSTEAVKEKLARLKAQNASLIETKRDEIPLASGSSMNGLNTRAILKERLLKEKIARLKAKRASMMHANGNEHEIHSPLTDMSNAYMNQQEFSPGQDVKYCSDREEEEFDDHEGQSVDELNRKESMKEILRSRLSNEKLIFTRNVNESKAQELRRRLLEIKAIKEKEQIDNNYGGMDNILMKMNVEERKKEVRRRLMRLKILNAETDQERKQRELKEKLIAKRKLSELS